MASNGISEDLESIARKYAKVAAEKDDLAKKLAEAQDVIKALEMGKLELQENLEKKENKAVIEIDKDGKITRANPLAEEFLGYTKKELMGMPFKDLGGSDEDARRICLIPTMAKFNYPGANARVYLKTKDGKTKLCEMPFKIEYENGAYDGAIFQIQEVGFWSRLVSGSKSYNIKAPEVLDEEFRQKELGKNVIAQVLDGKVKDVNMDFEAVQKIEERVMETLMGSIVGGKRPIPVYITNCSPTVKEYLVSKGFPEDNITLKKVEENPTGLVPSEQNNP